MPKAAILRVDIWPRARHHWQTSLSTCFQKRYQVPLRMGPSMKIKRAFFWLMPDPGHIAGDSVKARRLQLFQPWPPEIGTNTKVLKLACSPQPGLAIQREHTTMRA